MECDKKSLMGMKKIFVIILSLALSVAGLSPSKADSPNIIAIIDTGFNTSGFESSVVEEVCVTASLGCNNRTSFEIGLGAAGSKEKIRERSLEDWNHGTLMAQTILSVNPEAKLLLVRNSKTYGGTVLPGTEKDFEAALRWVKENAQKYNVVAISFSRGSHKYVSQNKEVSRLAGSIKVYESMVARLKATNNRLASTFEKKLNEMKQQLESFGSISCPTDNNLQNLIADLKTQEIATIVATGNDADKRYADYPACIDEAVAVTASDSFGSLVYVANAGPNTDFATEAPTTSEATARLAAKWSKLFNGSFENTYSLMVTSGTKTNHHSTVFVQ